ncbi:hypothetical protein [Pandoravirus japonicus]|uniref:Uncharacterized protein n=1 Tax=Pandoravirus japonicus TaxID=2823154 RepID=A0A811BMT5_9VIRU|nr:hypothetical protein [Pandoravirus japonicus]
MTRRHRQRPATRASDPSPPPSPLPPPVRRHAFTSSIDDDDDFSCSMLTDTSTFSSSDGKRAYSTTTTTTTTTRTAKRSPAPSTSTTASNWSCGWDAPLTSEPTLSSLPTYAFDNNDDNTNEDNGNEERKPKKGEKKASKKKHKKKTDGRRERSRSKGVHKGRTGARRRPTDAETDAEAYRTNRASDPWARSAVATSSKTDTETHRHDTARTPLATAASFSDGDDGGAGAGTERRDEKWHPRRDAAADEQTSTGVSALPVWHETSPETSASSSSSFDDGTDAPLQSSPTPTTTATTTETTSDGSSATTDETSFASSSSANCDPTATNDDSASATESARESQDHNDSASDATANDTRFDHDSEDDDDGTQGAPDDDAGAWESSAGGCHCHRCTCAESAADNDGTSDSDDDESHRCADHHARHGEAGPRGGGVAAAASSDPARASSSSSLSSSSSTATSDDWINVRVGPKVPREPPVYIRACHRGTTHRRGSLCDEWSDEGDDQDGDDTAEGGRGSSSGRAQRDGVVETHSVTIAEPLVRPCEPDAPHAIFGRPCSAHVDSKGRAPCASAPVVVAPGVRDLPGGVPESFDALGATYTLLAGAVDTRCRLESALVTLRGRARAQPTLVFEGADVNIVGVSGSGAITINGRTYPLTPTASFYVRAGSALAVGNAAAATPLVFVQQFVGAAAGLGFYREVATYEAAVGGAVNVDACVIEAIAARYHIRAALGPSSRRACVSNAFVPPGTVRFLPTPQCEADTDDGASSSSSSSCATTTAIDTDTITGGGDGGSSDDDDEDSDGSSCGPIDAGVDSWGLRRRQLLVLAAVGAGPAARPAATVRPTDLDALIALGQAGTRVTVRATVIRDPRSGGCADALARPTINGAEVITLLTGVAYWTYYDEAADNVIVQCVPGSRLPAVLPPAFGVVPAAGPLVGSAGCAPLFPQQGLPPIAVRPAPFV